ncbi:hypothetical protein [Streptomyces sp. NPDC021139]
MKTITLKTMSDLVDSMQQNLLGWISIAMGEVSESEQLQRR